MLENFSTGRRVTADPLVANILTFFDRPRPVEALVARLEEYNAASVRRAVAQLVRHGLLEPAGRAAPPALENWKSWNPHAGFFHFATKDVRYEADPLVIRRSMLAQARRTPLPPPGKRYPRARKIALPPPADGEFPRVLRARRTWRSFGRQPLGLPQLATLLQLSFGVQRWLDRGALGRFALKTSPSGGALTPLEAYVAVRRVAGLAPGIYHYDAVRHRLERLRRRVPPFHSYLPGQWWYDSAAALVLLTAVWARPQWKYKFPRAYRVVLAEAGHFAQTFCLTAAWLGLAPFCTMALADSRIERDLGLDGAGESALYAAGVGARPGGEWSPLPRRARAK